MARIKLAYLVFLGMVLIVTSCGKPMLAPVDEKGQPLRTPATSYRTVAPGDTLYSIAWEIGQDYRDLASWNQIDPPFVIYPGQKLILSAPTDSNSSTSTPGQEKYYTVKQGDTLYSIARKAGLNHRVLADQNGIPAPFTIVPGQKLTLKTAENSPPARKTKKTGWKSSQAKKSTEPYSNFNKNIRWNWPINGKIIGQYNKPAANKGIDISGRKGQEIRAASAGQVVYQGNSLRGYGNLVIIKHNEDYLSAYAHCDQIFVREGDVIKQAQKIASVGNSGTNRIKLHFEIRRRGTPVDPLIYLPKR